MIDLCQYTGGTTVASFDQTTGNYEFSMTDYEVFGTQSLLFEFGVRVEGVEKQSMEFKLEESEIQAITAKLDSG